MRDGISVEFLDLSTGRDEGDVVRFNLLEKWPDAPRAPSVGDTVCIGPRLFLVQAATWIGAWQLKLYCSPTPSLHAPTEAKP